MVHKFLFPGTALDRMATLVMAGVGFFLLLGPLPAVAIHTLSHALNWRLQREGKALSALEERLRGRRLPTDLPSFVARCLGRILSCPTAVLHASRPAVATILRDGGPRRVASLRRAKDRETTFAWEEIGGRLLLPVRLGPEGGDQAPPDIAIVLGASRKASRLPAEVYARLSGVLGSLQSALDSRAELQRSLETERRLQEGERLAMLGLLSASAAHEIKNPLSAIRNIAHAAGREAPEGSVLREDLAMIASEVDRLDATVRRMLHFARDRETCEDAVATLRSVCGLLDQESRSRGIRLELSCPEDAVPMPMSENDIKAVVFNLVLNALQHAPRGSAVRIDLASEGPSLSVSNDGEIPEDFRPRLFRPLASRGGTGLGLYICRKRAEEAQGRVVHLAEPGRTVFRLYWERP
jgi:signal transduction histidine kinase